MGIEILDKQYDAMMRPRINPHPLYVAHTSDGDITLEPGTYTSEFLDRIRDSIAAQVVEHLPPIKGLGVHYRKVNKFWFDWYSKLSDEERMRPVPYRCLPHV